MRGRIGTRWPRRAIVDRLDDVVLRRMSTLIARAGRGLGRRRDDVVAAVAAGASMPAIGGSIDDQFHRRFYESASTWQDSTYRGVTIWKNPLDLWIYQEILHAVRPDLIIETGTAYGGSALYLADLCDILGNGRVVTIDIRERAEGVEHPRLTKLVGSSADPTLAEHVATLVPDGGSVLVILDSDHRRDHVLAELRLWGGVVTPGSYLIVEDTNINGHPVYPDFGPGPWEALDTFLAESNDFDVDESRHKFLMTWNPRGFLRRRDTPAVADVIS